MAAFVQNMALIILTITCMVFPNVLAQNSTTSTMPAANITTTNMYTTMANGTMPTVECLFSRTNTIEGNNQTTVVVDICGYKVGDVNYVRVTVTLPANRWGALGFVSVGSFSRINIMSNVYAISFEPGEAEMVKERYMTANGNAGPVIPTKVVVESNVVTGSRRTIVLSRAAQVSPADGTAAQYFNFDLYQVCRGGINILYAYGYDGVTTVGYHEKNAGYIRSCSEVITSAGHRFGGDSQVLIVAVIASICGLVQFF